MEAGSLKPGQTRWVCLACEHQTISEVGENPLAVRCDGCGNAFLQAVKTAPTKVQGAGLGGLRDAGLVLLLEAQEK